MLAFFMLIGCSTPAPTPPAPTPVPAAPELAFSPRLAEEAAVYSAFMRDVESFEAGFAEGDAIQSEIRRGAAYEPDQFASGRIAYAAIVALQAPAFVAGVRGFAADPVMRQQVRDAVLADPAYAAVLPGADTAAGLIVSVLSGQSSRLSTVADAIEEDAYTIQGRNDPRRRWASLSIADRMGRLDGAKTLSETRVSPDATESTVLRVAAEIGSLNLAPADTRALPYSPTVINALAAAALSALGDPEGAGSLPLVDPSARFCLTMSKLNLFQCLPASKPHYEDMFCLGRHIVRDLATCGTEAIGT